ncbi:MAG: hypothetical protein GC151_07655 [Betaproteobacteria bacterium]|nr:hypothetical protein [Betaproteobacteria bacterium]
MSSYVNSPESRGREVHPPRLGRVVAITLGICALVGVGFYAVVRVLPRPSSALPETFVRLDAHRLPGAPVVRMLDRMGVRQDTRAVVVHFRDPSCRCTAAADALFLALARRQFGTDVLFAFTSAPGTGEAPVRGLERLHRVPPDLADAWWDTLSAAPAIAVFDSDGHPAFLGSYSSGPECSAARGGPVEAALAVIDGDHPDGVNPDRIPAGPVAGCVCRRRPRPHGQSDAGRPPAAAR